MSELASKRGREGVSECGRARAAKRVSARSTERPAAGINIKKKLRFSLLSLVAGEKEKGGHFASIEHQSSLVYLGVKHLQCYAQPAGRPQQCRLYGRPAKKIWPADSIRIGKGRDVSERERGGEVERAEIEGVKGQEAEAPYPI